mmetsp:Transcript_12994/g.30352  ORF Transcript_12994/g.30352 Transcript_12994/m.30352 type:complete len:643 (-) Transcript_12994:155-2083(-)
MTAGTTKKQSTLPAPAALNVYKKVAIIRGSEDVLTYEDSAGNFKTVTDLHLAAVATTPLHKPKPKDEIPVPEIKTNETYKRDILPNYDCPTSYVRYTRLSHEEVRDCLEYVVDTEDEEWLRNNSRFGGASIVVVAEADENVAESNDEAKEQSSPSVAMNETADPSAPVATDGTAAKDSSKRKASTKAAPKTYILTIAMLEVMLDVMEKATAFDAIITLDQAEKLILEKLPQFHHMYPVRAKAGVVTIRHVMNDVYQYWVSKRSKLKRPLLRRFWPVTSTEDSNPHLVFRPREKEKYKLRKKRQNDLDAYRKLQQLKQDFCQVRLLLGLIKKREELARSLVLLQKEWFEQKLYDAIDTSGLCRVSRDLDRRSLEKLMEVETHFDVSEVFGGRGRKKSRRSSGQQQDGLSSAAGSRSSTPVPTSSFSSGAATGTTSVTNQDRNAPSGIAANDGNASGLESNQRKLPNIIAGQNNGELAPSFLQPLASRESYATTWEGSTPHVTTIVDGRPMNTTRFRHRPRVGRGGRLCIDRVPLPTDPSIAPNTYYRAGRGPTSSLETKERLLDLLPPPIDKIKLSRRIEEICFGALKEEQDANIKGPGNTALNANLEDGDNNDGTEVLVRMKDWLNTDDQLWGEERYAIGPI